MNAIISFNGTIDNFLSFKIATQKGPIWVLNVDLCLTECQSLFSSGQSLSTSVSNSQLRFPGKDFILTVNYTGKLHLQMPMQFNFVFKNCHGTVFRTQKDTITDFGVTKQLTRYFRKSEFPSLSLLYFQVDIQQGDLTPNVSVSSLPQKMLNLLNSKNHSDFIIRVEETDIPVHKCILANSSAVFEAMLLSGMSETVTGRVEINNLTLATVQEMLKFMYSGLIQQPTVLLAFDLLRASDIYDMDDLQACCHQYLKECLGWNNVFKVLVSTHELNDLKLKDICYNFLITNRQQNYPTAEFQEELKKRCDLAIELLLKMWK